MNADLLNLDSASCPRPSGRQVLETCFDTNYGYKKAFNRGRSRIFMGGGTKDYLCAPKL